MLEREIFILLFLLVIFGIVFYKFTIKNKKYLKKIEILKYEIIKKNKKQYTKKIQSYHIFFKIVRHIFTHFKPETISVYIYDKKPELDTTIMKFLYQIKSDGGDGSIIFTGDYNNIPISNIYAVTKLYNNNSLLSVADVKELSKYDQGLYTYLNNTGIKSLYLANIYCKKRKTPIGFFTLTYKDIILNEVEEKILVEEIDKISSPLKDIIN